MGFQFNQIFRSTIKNPLPLCCLIWVPKKPLYGILGSKKSHFLSLFIMIYSNLEKSLFFNFSTSFSISLCVGVSFGWFRFCYHLFFFFFFGDSDLLLFFSVNKEKVTECFSIVDDLLNFVIVVFLIVIHGFFFSLCFHSQIYFFFYTLHYYPGFIFFSSLSFCIHYHSWVLHLSSIQMEIV